MELSVSMAEVIVLFLDSSCYYVYMASSTAELLTMLTRVVEIAWMPSYGPSNDLPAHQCDM